MTAEDNKPQNNQQRADVDMELTSEGIRRFFNETKKRGYERLQMDEEELNVAAKLGKQFLAFVRDNLSKLGTKSSEADKPTPLMSDAENSDWNDILKDLWNKRAKAWGWVESAANYQLTFSTLITFLETNPAPKKERIVSLGSGPGLYESFFMLMYPKLGMPSKLEMFCVDFSEEMTAINRRIINTYKAEDGKMISNVKPTTGDMANLDFPDRFFDQIICNNSLQWVPDWKKAISEMARVINPEGLGVLYLFVHRHPMKLINEETKETLLSIGDVSPTELLDILEQNNFQIENTRQIKTAKGLGQAGGTSDRMFIKARYNKNGVVRSWRNTKVEAATHYAVSKP